MPDSVVWFIQTPQAVLMYLYVLWSCAKWRERFNLGFLFWWKWNIMFCLSWFFKIKILL